jgi:hypothetical protein
MIEESEGACQAQASATCQLPSNKKFEFMNTAYYNQLIKYSHNQPVIHHKIKEVTQKRHGKGSAV